MLLFVGNDEDFDKVIKKKFLMTQRQRIFLNTKAKSTFYLCLIRHHAMKLYGRMTVMLTHCHFHEAEVSGKRQLPAALSPAKEPQVFMR
jgi:hypothetical protein